MGYFCVTIYRKNMENCGPTYFTVNCRFDSAAITVTIRQEYILRTGPTFRVYNVV